MLITAQDADAKVWQASDFTIGERVSDPEGRDGVVVDVGDERFSDYRRGKYCVDYDDEAPLTWWAKDQLVSRDR